MLLFDTLVGHVEVELLKPGVDSAQLVVEEGQGGRLVTLATADLKDVSFALLHIDVFFVRRQSLLPERDSLLDGPLAFLLLDNEAALGR